jgi:DNA-binding response OmpR family regulator
MRCILSFGYDHCLMSYRSLILRNAGYEVIEAFSCAQALRIADSDAVDLVLICHTVSALQKRRLTRAIEMRRRLMPVFSIANCDFMNAVERFRTAGSDPEQLLRNIQTAISSYSTCSTQPMAA